MRDPYDVLGIRRGASKDEIRAAYRELVKRYHPDKFQSNPDMLKLAEEKMKEVNEAYNYLINHIDDDDVSRDDAEDERIYAQVRQMIQSGAFYEAEDLLVKVSDKSNPEWYFLNGIIYAQRGWYDKAHEYIKHAYEMRPDNQEYAQAYRSLSRASKTYGPVYNGGQMNETGQCLSCCATLACADLCCNCMGGGC